MKIGSYIILRMLAFILQVIGGIFLLFFIFDIMPYSPIGIFLFTLQPGSEAEREALIRSIRNQWAIDQPIYIQVFNFIQGLVTEGSLGSSWFGGSVNSFLADSLPYTLTIFVISFLLYTIFSVILGIFSASNDNTFVDKFLRMFTSAGYGIPYFIFAIMAIYFINDTNFIIDGGVSDKFINNLKYLLLPIAIIVISYTSYQFRIIRTELRNILSKNYIRTARAKGLPERIVIYKHGLRNGITQIITSSLVTFPLAITAIVVIEPLFNIPGLGNLFIGAATNLDWGILIGLSTLFLIFNGIMIMIVDIITVLINPRTEN